MRLTCLVASLWFLMASAVLAAPMAAGFAGWWAVRVGHHNLMVLHLETDATGKFTGELARPGRFSLNTVANAASDVSGPTIHEPVIAFAVREGALFFTVRNPRRSEDTDKFRMRLDGVDKAQLSFVDTPLPPLSMVRTTPDTAVAEDWMSGQTYVAADPHPSNAELTRLFDADQAARTSGKIDWAVVSKQDELRRQSVAAMLAQGALHTPDDFWHAAFIFQHGDKTNDYLLAHTLAMVAVKKGRADAIWIAAATLDRYLQTSGKAQIYGTQFQMPDNGATTQEPYDRSLVSDALRAELDVPSQAAQEAQRAEFEKKAHQP